MRGGLDRRGLLRALAAAVVGLLGPARGKLGPASRPETEALLGVLGSRRSARAVGRAYLRQYPSEADAQRLTAALWGDLGSGGGLPPGSTLHRRLSHRVRDDFAQERVVWVSGWLLARSEARLCALAALA